MDDLTLGLLAINIVLAGVGIAFWCIMRYELAVFLVALSPGISAVFVPNTPDADIPEAGLGSYIRISLLLLMGGVGLVKFFKSRSMNPNQERLPFHFILLGVFALFTLISTSYSIDQRYTFIRSVSLIAVFGFLLGFNSWLKDRRSLDQALNTLFLLVCFGTIVNLISLVILPEKVWWYKQESRFQGLLGHPNAMGEFCMLSYFILIWKYPRCNFLKKCIVATLILTILCLHLLTGSRSSLIASVFGICVWLLVSKKIVKLMFVLGVVSIAALCIVQLKPDSFNRGEDSTGFTDLTGRPEFWFGAYTLIMERPILGYGYEVEGKIWSDPRFNKPEYVLWSGTARTSLHNGYLSIAIGVGIVGFLICCVLLLIPFWRCRTLPCSDYKAFVISIMLIALLLNFFESVVAVTASVTAIFFWIAWVIAGKLSQKY